MKRSADYYSKLARQSGYPARSVFKLQEMQERFSLFRAGQSILELGSAPGSWSKFCLQHLGNRGSLVAVDLEPVCLDSPSAARYRFLQGDIFSEQMAATLREWAPFNAVFSDAAPRTSGSGLVDAEVSLQIAQRVLEIGCKTLRTGGNLVVKIFQGGGEGRLLKQMKAQFRQARAFKPQACRNQSRETYFIGLFFAAKS